jgi:UDPglucose--hexose-1-phosphate uridylyltransferase
MSEFRKDPVSEEWSIIAPERAKRPGEFGAHARRRIPTPIETCPFEDLEKTGNWPPYILAPNRDWRIAVIPNKFPALEHAKSACSPEKGDPMHIRREGVGYHDLLVFRDHTTRIDELPEDELVAAFHALQKRYLIAAADPCLRYTATHFNWGETAGASLYHPHIQILSLPIIPPHIAHSLAHATRYFKEAHTCVHCAIIAAEEKEGERIIEKTNGALVLVPFAARNPFETKIYPRQHEASFEHASEDSIRALARALQHTLSAMHKALGDPDLNFFLHTAPLRNKEAYAGYHWHIEIIPKFSIRAGFELGTGVDINIVAPETAAEVLKKALP